MNSMEQMSTVIECRRLASFYRTRAANVPMNDQERQGLAGLLTGVAALIEGLQMVGMPADNVIFLARQR